MTRNNVKQMHIPEIDEINYQSSEASETPYKEVDNAGFLAFGSLSQKVATYNSPLISVINI